MNKKLLNKRLSRTFKRRITIKKREINIIGGRQVETWSDYYSCLSNPTELFGDELYQAINVKYKTTAVFEVKSCKLIEEMRFKEKEFALEYNEMLFDIYHIDYLKNDGHVAIIKVKRND